MSEMSDNKRYAPPHAELAEPLPEAGGLDLGSRSRRFWAAMIDGLLGAAVFFPCIFLTIGVEGYMRLVMERAQGGSVLAMYLAIFQAAAPAYALLLLIQGGLVYASRQTVGKKLLGLRVVRSDGAPASFARVFFVRGGSATLLPMIPGIGGIFALLDLCLIFRDSRQCLHDTLADTTVVRVPG